MRLQKRRAERADHLQCRQVRLVEVGVLEQRDDLGRHGHDVRHALGCQGFEHRTRLERRQEDVRAAEIERRHQRHEGPVEDERARVEDHTLGMNAKRTREARAVGFTDPVRVDNSLGIARRAGAVDDVERVVTRESRSRRRRRGSRVRQTPVGAFDAQEPVIREPEPWTDRVHLRREALRRDECRDVGVENEVEEPLGAKQGAERYDDDTRLHCREVDLEQLDRVVEQKRHPVTLAEPEAEESIRRAVRLGVELGVGQPLCAEDERELVAPVTRVSGGQRLEAQTVSPQRTTLAAQV